MPERAGPGRPIDELDSAAREEVYDLVCDEIGRILELPVPPIDLVERWLAIISILPTDKTPQARVAAAADRRICISLANGDRHEAIKMMLQEYGHAVHAFCSSALPRHQRFLVEGVVRDVFCQAYANMYSFRGNSIRGWLMSIAYECSLKVRRGSR